MRTLEDRFWSKVDRSGEHWLWTGAHIPGGYGSIAVDREHPQVGAHVVGYQLQVGEVPPGLQVQHTCDIRDCVRGDHLKVGRPKENAADMMQRARWKGGNNAASFGPTRRAPSWKLTRDQIARIRSSTAVRPLARELGVAPSVIQWHRNGGSYRKPPS